MKFCYFHDCRMQHITIVISITILRLTVVSRAAKKLQSARPIKRRTATTVSYLRVGPVLQY